MDGLTFLQKIMSQHPIPVVICSSLAEEGAQSTLRSARIRGGGDHRQAAPGHQTVPRGFARDALPGREGGGRARGSGSARPAANVEPKLTADAILSSANRRHARNHGESGGDRRLHGRNRGAASPARSPAAGCARHRDRAAHAGIVHPGLRQPTGQPVRDLREGGGNQRHGSARARADCAGQSSPAAQAQRRPLLRRHQGRAAGVPPSPFGGRAVPLRRALRGTETRWA